MGAASSNTRRTLHATLQERISVKTIPFTIQTKAVFDGKSLLGKAGFTRLSGHQQVS
jgi:hypothetical protein